MPEQWNSNWEGLSAGAIGLYVTVRLLTTDVFMLSLRKMSSPEFKHSNISPSFSLWKYPLPFCVYSEIEFLSASAYFLTQARPRHIFNFFLKFILCFTKTIFENIANMLFRLLIEIIGYNMGSCFQGLFSYSLCPWIQQRFNKTKKVLWRSILCYHTSAAWN